MIEIGSIGNYYGGLNIKIEDNKYYWGIEDWNGTYWEEITKSLYDELVKFENRNIEEKDNNDTK